MSYSSTDYSPARKGGRRRSPRDRGARRPRRGTPAPPPRKLSFWEKVVRFFKRGSSPQKTARPSKSRIATAKPPQEKSAAFRSPEIVDVTTPRLYVGNLSFEATESDLFELFHGVGSVQNVEIVCYRDSQRSKGFGFVQMQTVEEAKRAVADLHDKPYMGRKLVVSGAKAPPEGREARSERSSQASETEKSVEVSHPSDPS